jgi:hypothetical protein
MAINVSLPIEAPTGLSATLLDGGSLDASTTYYYVVIAFPDEYISPRSITTYGFHSPVSTESSFTTTDTQRSVTINWTDVSTQNTNHRYQILLTKTSGDYTNSPSVAMYTENLGNIKSGVDGYTFTEEADGTYVCHSVQLVNNLFGDIPKETGTLKVQLSGDDIHDLDDIYDAIITAGYSDYVVYDGFNFILKGWIYVEVGETGTGRLRVRSKNLVFIKGGVSNRSETYICEFGYWAGESQKAEYQYGCQIDLQHSRYPFRAQYPGRLQVYECLITSCNSVINDESENFTTMYYHTGAHQNLSYYIDEIRDTMQYVGVRRVSGAMKDMKTRVKNNFPNGPMIRIKWLNIVYMPYCQDGTFYDCEFLTSEAHRAYALVSHATNGYYSNFYDCAYPTRESGMIEVGDIYFNVGEDNLLPDNRYYRNYTIKLKVIDENGNALEGASVSAKDKDGNEATWIEKDGTTDELASGNTYNTPRTTDSNGEVDYYIRSYDFQIDPSNSEIGKVYNLLRTSYYPYTITLSKPGYKDYVIKITTLNKKIEAILTLGNYEYIPYRVVTFS